MDNKKLRKQIRVILKENLLQEQGNRMKFNIDVPDDILKISNVFQQNNSEIFLVGGCVRDSLLGKQPKDWDLCTSIHPDKVIEILKHASFIKHILETGKAFGVVNVITDNGEYEIATMRIDVGSGRRPDSVEFTDMKKDSLRRDLSYNALYYDISTKEIIDFVGGIEDLKNNITRTVGNPLDRFGEDKLRKLRALRFSARFGSELNHDIDTALKKDSGLDGVSGERIRDEFLKGVKSAKSVKYFLELLQKYHMFNPWIFGNLLVKEKGMQSMDLIEERDIPVLLAYLLSDNNVDELKHSLNSLKYSVNEIMQISFLVSLKQLSADNVFKFKKAQVNCKLTHEQIKKFAKWMKLDSNLIDCFLRFQLTVSGKELMDLGFSGKLLGAEIEKRETENFLGFLN